MNEASNELVEFIEAVNKQNKKIELEADLRFDRSNGNEAENIMNVKVIKKIERHNNMGNEE